MHNLFQQAGFFFYDRINNPITCNYCWNEALGIFNASRPPQGTKLSGLEFPVVGHEIRQYSPLFVRSCHPLLHVFHTDKSTPVTEVCKIKLAPMPPPGAFAAVEPPRNATTGGQQDDKHANAN